MKKYLLIGTVLLAAIACTKEKENAVSECIQDRLKNFDENESCDNAMVLRYMFQDMNVYTFDRGNCSYVDSVEVYDEDCNLMGYLGGYLNNTDINGVNFYGAAELKSTIWTKQ